MKILKQIVSPLCLILLASLSSHANAQQSTLQGQSINHAVLLSDLMSDKVSGLTTAKPGQSEINEMRKTALSEIAVSLGASAGLVSKMTEIKLALNNRALSLDGVADFSKMLITDGVLAPVLSEGLANYAQDGDDQVRIADKIYKIESRARFVSVYPTWRDYLQFSFKPFEVPPKSYLPKNEAENVYWNEWVKKGWEQGERQAWTIFESSYGRLRRDITGMIRYKILAAQNLITKPVIAKANLGVTGGGNEMAINDQIFRIVDHSSLVPNKSEWKVDYPISNYDGKKYQ